MPNYNTDIDFDAIIRDNTPIEWYEPNRVTWFNVLLKPFKMIYLDFQAVKSDYLYKVAYNGQVCMLQRILNDKFDNVNRGIYITERGLINIEYQFYKIEGRVDHYGYYKYDAAHSYQTGNRCLFLGVIYESLTSSNVGNTPDVSPSNWLVVRNSSYRRYDSEYDLSGGFIVNVPVAVTFDETYMRSLIEYYKLAGRPYQINIV